MVTASELPNLPSSRAELWRAATGSRGAGDVHPAVRLSSVSTTYQGASPVHALRNVSVTFASGSFTAVMGPSGSGKSTFLHCAAGLDRPTNGSVWSGDIEISTFERVPGQPSCDADASGLCSRRSTCCRPLRWRRTSRCRCSPGMRFDFTTRASPQQVLRALTDFTESSLETWNRTLDPKRYELRESGQTWAVARESSPGSPFWVVVRYDWSDAETVRWTVLDSSYGGGGEGLVQIARGVDGGSQVHAEWTYTGARLMQRPLIFLINHGMGGFISRMWVSALDRYAESSSR
jgi:energy-coupling factor transporter ATP-binding protein EcfA2